jgi:hypothetical protein
LEVQSCAGVEAGQVTARGLGLLQAQEVTELWLAPSLGLGARWAAGTGGAIRSRVELLAPLLRHRYLVNVADPVHATPGLTLRAALGFDVNLL